MIKITGNLFIDNKKIVSTIIERNYSFIVCDDGTKLLGKDFRKQIYGVCLQCNKRFEIRSGLSYHKDRTICISCSRKGERNSFYGKHHKQETKDMISNKNRGRLVGDKNPAKRLEVKQKIKNSQEKIKEECLKNGKPVPWIKIGKDNGFYGKHHKQETKDAAKKTRKENFQKMSKEEQKNYIKNLSDKAKQNQRIIKEKNLEKYIADRKKAGQISKENPKSYKMNNLETKVYKKLKEMDLDFEFSVILNFKQYDFGNKENRILLEVHGDYWHANPKFYGEDKIRKVNKTQIMKQNVDKDKEKFAIDHNFKYFVIWEDDVNNNNFDILNKIQYYINSKKLENLNADQIKKDQ